MAYNLLLYNRSAFPDGAYEGALVDPLFDKCDRLYSGDLALAAVCAMSIIVAVGGCFFAGRRRQTCTPPSTTP